MAKSKETFSKKEKEKKRQKQKQEKRQKMEARKAERASGQSQGGTLAWLDENGHLVDSPPDPKRRREFKVEDIAISVPRHEPASENDFRTGVVSFYNKAKGFGFINEPATGERLFFHVNDILEPLDESDQVRFFVERSARGFNAVHVSKQ
jgi:cold shock CspA family protein